MDIRKKRKTKKKSSVKKVIFTLIVVLIVLLIILGLYLYYTQKPVKIVEKKGIKLTEAELPTYLKEHPLIQGLPDEADIQINFDDESFAINGEDVEGGVSEEPDVVIDVPEEYIEIIGEEGLCGATQEAIENGDVEVETSLSEAGLLWKYKGMLKYKECVGF